MFDPNKPSSSRNYERVENVLAEMVPDTRTFKGNQYPEEDVERDDYLLYTFKNSPEYKRSEERSDARVLERTFMDSAERNDWFGEQELYSDNPNVAFLITFPTTDIDDAFNHIDTVCMIKNKATNYEVTPFAIDLTYNTDEKKLARKFRWRHVYGKKKNANINCSEFGEVYTEKDDDGNEMSRTHSLPLKFRYGLKIPGFASAKYFEDTNASSPWNVIHQKGRIEIMPRFIIGYPAEIATAMAGGLPTSEDRAKLGDEVCKKQVSAYNSAERRAKWCTLLECAEQASNIRYMLEHLSADETKWMRPEELEKAKEQIKAMDNYFKNAVEVANKQAQSSLPWKIAAEYAKNNEVVKAIIRHGKETYVDKTWQQ